MNLQIISIERAVAEGVSPSALMDIADWHSDKAALSDRQGDKEGAKRHLDISDRMFVVAARLRREINTLRRVAA